MFIDVVEATTIPTEAQVVMVGNVEMKATEKLHHFEIHCNEEGSELYLKFFHPFRQFLLIDVVLADIDDAVDEKETIEFAFGHIERYTMIQDESLQELRLIAN
jgi:hypothetical protein